MLSTWRTSATIGPPASNDGDAPTRQAMMSGSVGLRHERQIRYQVSECPVWVDSGLIMVVIDFPVRQLPC